MILGILETDNPKGVLETDIWQWICSSGGKGGKSCIAISNLCETGHNAGGK